MSSFIAICNPRDVWDFRAFFKTSPISGYWCVTKVNFDETKLDDIYYLRVTSRDPEAGIHAKFRVVEKRCSICPDEFWKPGKRPEGLTRQILFAVDRWVSESFISVSELKDAGLNRDHRTISVPQSLSSRITATEVEVIEKRFTLR